MGIRQIGALIRLARVDGILSEDEVRMINHVAEAKGLSPKELETLFYEEEEGTDLDSIKKDERFGFLCMLVQLMKIDRRIYLEELILCVDAADKLKTDLEVLFFIILYTKALPEESPSEEEMSALIAREATGTKLP